MSSDTKQWYASKTIWGAIIVLVAQGATLAGFDIGDTTLWVENITTLIGTALAIYGRVVAVKPIGKN